MEIHCVRDTPIVRVAVFEPTITLGRLLFYRYVCNGMEAGLTYLVD